MSATNLPHSLIAAALLLTTSCASAEMARNTADGDDIGGSGLESSGGSDPTADSASATVTTTVADDSTTDVDPTNAVEDSSTDPSDSDPSDPSDSDPSDSTGPDPSDSSGSDPSDSDPSDSDPSTGEGSTDDGATTDATDTEAPAGIDLSGYLVIQTNSFREFVIPDGTIVPAGGMLVIGRDASAATFQNFWGVNWGDEVVYIEGLDSFPTINGAETYTLRDPARGLIDGPTPALEIATSAARVDAGMPGDQPAAWEVAVSPNDTAMPGVSAAIGATAGVPYISEYADTTGNGNFGFEFVEIHVPL